jgi:microcystin-dependent protein
MGDWRFLTPENAPAPASICRVLRLPADREYLALAAGALFELTLETNWEAFGAQTPADTADYWRGVLEDWYLGSACMIGAIVAIATEDIPSGMLLCDGTQYARIAYPVLYSVLASEFIDDADYFTVPDLSSKFVRGMDEGTENPGDSGGQDGVTLVKANLPDSAVTDPGHTHTANPHTHTEITAIAVPDLAGELPLPGAAPGGGVTGPATVVINSATTGITLGGSSEEIDNRPAYVALRYAIVAR